VAAGVQLRRLSNTEFSADRCLANRHQNCAGPPPPALLSVLSAPAPTALGPFLLGRRRIRGRVARYPQPTQEVALSNQYRVCSSVQPGTAKRAGAVTPWLGRTMTCWRVRKCTVGGLERCTVAASAEAHRVINRPKAKQNASQLLQSTYRRSARAAPPPNATRAVPASHSWGARGRFGTVSAGGSRAGREIARY
jgi:hypothetical protein